MKKLTNIKYGDIINLGDHVIACGDCRDKQLVHKLIGNTKINEILTDMPYGVSYTESKKGFNTKISCDKAIANDEIQSDETYSKFTADWLKVCIPYLAKKNSIYLFNCDKMLFALHDGMLKVGCKFSQLIIWIKNQSIIGRLDFLPQHELIIYGWFGTHKFMKAKDKSVLFYPKPHCSKLHPSTKPTGLLRRLILNSSKINDVIYDPFLGSGSTLIAAEQTHRKCIGIELDPQYCQTIVDRYNNLKK